MNRIVRFAILAAASLFASSAMAGDGSRHRALLIGVSHYDPDQLQTLPTAAQDVSRLADLLTRGGYAGEDVVVMSSTIGASDPMRLPTLGNLRDQLQSIVKSAGSEDSLIIAFRGHGLQSRGGKLCLCPFDADLEDEQTLLTIDELYAALVKCRSKQTLLLIDAMNTNPFASDIDSRVSKRYQPTMPKLPPTPANTVAFVSCGVGEAVTTDSNASFLAKIADGIAGSAAGSDGSVTLPDLERFVKKQTQRSTSHPVVHNNSAGLFTILSHSLGQNEMDKIQTLIRGDRYDEALVIVRKRLETNPNDATALAQHSRLISYKAEQFRDYSQMDQALSLANRAIQNGPNESLPYVARSNVYRINKAYEKAFADAQTAVEKDPNNVMAHVISAFAMHHLHDLDGMRREAKAGMEIDPEHPEARATYVAFLFANGRLDDGHAELDRAIAIVPDMPALYFLKGYGYEQQGKHREAVAEYTKAIELNDQIPGYFCRRSISRAGAGDHQGAMADVAAAEKVDPNYVDIAAARTVIMQMRHGLGHGEDTIAAGLETNPESADLWQGKGVMFMSQGKYSQAIDAFNKALEINPGYGEAHMGIGMVYKAQGRLDDALLHLNRATRHKEHLARAYFEKSSVFIQKKDYNTALAEVDKALHYDPNEPVSQQQRANLIRAGAISTAGTSSTPKQPVSNHTQPITGQAGKQKASIGGKYTGLLYTMQVPGDAGQYGAFHDYGRWNETTYAGHRNLPAGYWVYVYPNWYIWKNVGTPTDNAPTDNTPTDNTVAKSVID